MRGNSRRIKIVDPDEEVAELTRRDRPQSSESSSQSESSDSESLSEEHKSSLSASSDTQKQESPKSPLNTQNQLQNDALFARKADFEAEVKSENDKTLQDNERRVS